MSLAKKTPLYFTFITVILNMVVFSISFLPLHGDDYMLYVSSFIIWYVVGGGTIVSGVVACLISAVRKDRDLFMGCYQ